MAGRLQFKFPILQFPLRKLASALTNGGPGAIRYGEGKGLIFNAEFCNPGFLLGTSEPLEQQMLAKLLKPGDVFYDVGANAGFYCVIAARLVGPEGKVYAFEPTPELADRVEENAGLNQFNHIEVIRVAVGDCDEEVKFGVGGGFSVSNSLNLATSESASITVSCITLDRFFLEHRAPTLILMDIEGAELKALHGAMECIRKHLPTIMVEVHWIGDPFLQFYESYLRPLGYVATTYDGQPLPEGNVRFHCLLQVTNRIAPVSTSSGAERFGDSRLERE